MKKTARLKNILATLKKGFAFCARHTGIYLVYLGVLLYAVFYFTGLTNYNILLYIPLLLIILGTIGFVKHKKVEGEY